MCVNTTRLRLAADDLCRLDERPLPDRQHDAAGHSGVDHPPVDGEDQRDRRDAAADERDQQHRQQQPGKRHLHVDPAHQPAVDAATLVARHAADEHAERAGEAALRARR